MGFPPMGGILPRVNRPMLAAVGLAPPRLRSLRRVQDVLTSRAATGSIKPGDKAGAYFSQRRFGTVRVTSSVSGLLLIRLFKQPNSILGLVRASTATACGNLKQADKQKPTTGPGVKDSRSQRGSEY